MGAALFSQLLSRTSAAALLLGGLAFLFIPDTLLPLLVPGYPPAGAWLGQLLAAAWLGLATLNWLSRSALLGGIYGRPVVATNFVAYFVGATSLLSAATSGPHPTGYWVLAAPVAILAMAYGWLFFRGPLQRDFDIHARTVRVRAEAP